MIPPFLLLLNLLKGLIKLMEDFQTATNWTHRWKLVFNSNITDQAIAVIFSVEKKRFDHPELIFNGIPVARQDYTKPSGIYLDSWLNFSKHTKDTVIKEIKGISLLKHLFKYVTRKVFFLCYKLCATPS